MSTINKLKLWLLTMMMMVGANVFGTNNDVYLNTSTQTAYFDKFGGEKAIEIFSNDPEGWTATSSASWLMVEGVLSYAGIDSKIIILTAQMNFFESREATVTITDHNGNTRTVNVSQLGDRIELFVNPTQVCFTEEGGSKKVDIICNSDLGGWYAVSSADWLKINGAKETTGEGIGSITLEAAYYSGSMKHEAIVTVSDGINEKHVIVSQFCNVIELYVSPTVLNYTKEGGSKQIEIVSNDPEGWTATSGADWLKVNGSATAMGNGNGWITLMADENNSSNNRESTVTVTDHNGNAKTVNVIQLGNVIWLYLSPTALSYSAEGGKKTIVIASNDPEGWTATSSESWLTIEGASSYKGMGNESIIITAEPYSGNYARQAIITVSDKNGHIEIVKVSYCVNVIQLNVSPAQITYSKEGGSMVIDIVSNDPEGWTATSGADWLTVNGFATAMGKGNGKITLMADENNSSNNRESTVTVTDHTRNNVIVTVIQFGIDSKIESIENKHNTTRDVIYDLNGKAIQQNKRGVHIHNKMKVIKSR